MKLKHWIRFLLYRDSTWHGQFASLGPLLLQPADVERTVVDVGANDGFYSSNSYPFISRGWHALLIEPHPVSFRKAQRLHRKRNRVIIVNAACSDHAGDLDLQTDANDDGGSCSVLSGCPGVLGDAARSPGESIPVKVHRLETLLEEFHVPPEFGLLTIDTEGHDLRVLRGTNLARYRPRVIITENNPDDEEKAACLRDQGYRLHAALPYDTVWTCR